MRRLCAENLAFPKLLELGTLDEGLGKYDDTKEQIQTSH